MIPPVSLPLKGGTVSARAGAPASIPHIATRQAAPIIRIADSIRLGVTLKGIGPRGKNGGSLVIELAERCGRVALDRARPSRHRLPGWFQRRIPHARPLRTLEKTRQKRRRARRPARIVCLRPAGRSGLSLGAEFRPVRAEL